MTLWHTLSETDVLQDLGVDSDQGLSAVEVGDRRQKSGPNELVETNQRSPWQIVWEQLSGAMVLLLFGAAVVSLVLHEVTDAIAIVTIIVLNAILGFVQDYRAERALAALKKLAVPTVRVRRDGVVAEVSARELVPGDIVLLEAGQSVPADCRVLESVNLKVQESALTGESEAVEKTIAALTDESLPVADRTNMAWMGTTLTYGHGVAVVVHTGMQTELGHIAASLQSVETGKTPLQQRLARMGRSLAIVALLIVAVVFGLGLLRGEDPQLMLMTALSLAVAVVPEGLPAVATVALALGARRMYRRRALIRKLPAVETLGSVTVICSDKTGTLTENRMTVTVLDVAGRRVDCDVNRSGGADTGESEDSASEQADSALSLLLIAASLCNDSELQHAEPGDQNRVEGGDDWQALGDPTETALVIAAARRGLPKTELSRLLPRVAELPFDSDRKRMTTVHRPTSADDVDNLLRQQAGPLLDLDESDCVALTKGAVDSVLACCDFVWSDDEPLELTDEWRQRIQAAGNELAGQGMRVLGLAMRPVDDVPQQNEMEALESELIFIGLIGMIDPPRQEAKEAVARCRAAGIRPVMITGDHPLTALYIARQLGIADDTAKAVTGQDLAGKQPSDLESMVESISVYARVSPKDKLHIVQTLQNRGHVVAMTGDGVNDAPALKQAHIGVAMGQVGTDVSKEASEMVLLDDNFATIVNAVEEGRIVYDNIRKFVKYTMTSNAGEVGVMVLGPLMGMPLPLLPLQILWINLVTDGLPGLALAVEPAERNTMKRPPLPLSAHIFGRGMGIDIAWIGLLMAVVSLAMGYWVWADGSSEPVHWRTMIFTVLTLSQMGNVMAIRSDTDSLFRIGTFSNRPLVGAVLLTFSLQLAVIYVPAMQHVFRTTALTFSELLVCLAMSTIVFAAVELRKLFSRSRRPTEGMES